MNGHPRHPGTEALAEFRAGVIDGTRGEQVAAHVAACPQCASVSERLGEVTTALASIPAPTMPRDLEARIASALAAEAARRDPAAVESASPDLTAASVGAVPSSEGSPGGVSPVPRPVTTPSPATARRRSRRRPAWQRSVTAPLGVFAAAAAYLVLAFVGYWLSGPGHQAAPSVASGGPAHAGQHNPAGQPGAHRLTPPLTPAIGGPASSSFVVQVAATNFSKSTLQAQVRQQLTPGSGESGGSRALPSRSLVACVMHVTGDRTPKLVEEARYQSQPAYVIAVPDHAWVVARGCTPAHPEMLTSVALASGR